MPIEIRKWWIKRTNKAREEEKGIKPTNQQGHVDPFGRTHNK